MSGLRPHSQEKQEGDPPMVSSPARALSHFPESTWLPCRASPHSLGTISTARASSETSRNGQLALKKPVSFVWVTFNLGFSEWEHPVQLVIICQPISAIDRLQNVAAAHFIVIYWSWTISTRPSRLGSWLFPLLRQLDKPCLWGGAAILASTVEQERQETHSRDGRSRQ